MEEQIIESFFNQILTKSDFESRQKCIQIFKNNGINKVGDLLKLIYKKTSKENNNSNTELNSNITNNEKTIIKSLYEKGYSLDDILEVFIDKKHEQVKKYFKSSILKTKKPIPKNLVQIEMERDESLPCFLYPSKKIPGKKYYTLLLLGESLSGKTALLDAFVNYLSGIEFDDEWRYRLSSENKYIISQYECGKTNQITSYYINYNGNEKLCEKEINIRIIDTPGFGEPRTILYDIKIIKQLKQLFKEIGELDYILLIYRSNTTRISLRFEYILDRMYEILGMDTVERLMAIYTFADGRKPKIIDTLKETDYYLSQDYFCFDNSCLYHSKNNDSYEFAKTYWEKGFINIKKLLDVIIQKNLSPLSLDMSIKVIENREQFFNICISSRETMNKALNNLEKYNNLLIRKENINKESLIKLGKEIEESIKLITNDIKSVKNCLTELDKIALKPRVFKDESIFKKIIKEKLEYQTRIVGSKEMEEDIQQINLLLKAENIYQIFPQYNNVLKELNIKNINII